MPWHETEYYAAHSSLGANASAIAVALVGIVALVSLLMIALGCMQQAYLRAKAARIAEAGAENRELRPGYLVVRGQVATDDGQAAVRVRIVQQGRAWRDKHGYRHHSWREISREVIARPFRLVLASGEAVRVEPNAEVYLADDLDVTRGLEPTVRERAAELMPGEHAYVSGELVASGGAGPYRGSEERFVMRPYRRERMLVSVGPLEESHEKRMRLHRRWALGCVAALVLMNGLVFRGYWLRLTEGQLVTAIATQTRTWTTQTKHGVSRHYGVDATTHGDGGESLELTSEVNPAYYDEVRSALARGASPSVPFLVVGSDASTGQIGTRPTIVAAAAIFTFIALLIFGAVYAANVSRARLWYERKRVVEGGTGGLEGADRLE